MNTNLNSKQAGPNPQMWLIPLLLLGFWLRFTFLLGNVYYGDEFISMLAAKMVAVRGLPILPSGLFYDHGLLYSMTAGAFVALLGFSEQVARWPVLLVSVFTIAVYYAVAKKLFNSHITGIIAAILITFDTTAMKWGVWARMYALAHLFVLLTIAWFLFSTLKYSSQPRRSLFLLFLAGMLFSHTLTFLLLPPLAILLLLVSFTYRRRWLLGPALWRQVIIGAVIIAAALWLVANGHVGSTISLQDREPAALSLPAGLRFLQGFFLFNVAGDNYDSLFDYFQTSAYGWLLYFIGVALLLALYRVVRRRATCADAAFLSILALLLLVILEMGTVLSEEWRQSRYMFFLGLPAFMLLSAESLSRLLRGSVVVFTKSPGPFRPQLWLEAFMPLLVLIPIALVWGRPTLNLARVRATGDYDSAYDFVRQNWQPGDRIMTEHPAAAYLYMEQTDFYANQTSAKVLGDDDGEFAPVDRYTGSPLIDTAEALNRVLAQGHRVWLVVGDKHLSRYYDNLFRQQIFAQMDFVYQAGTKYVLLSRSYPMPLAPEPKEAVEGNFDNRILLGGYSLDLATIAPDGTSSVGLYWRLVGDPPPQPVKVFVQLRNGQGQTIAQADHFFYDGLFTSSHWQALRQQGDWLRDTADLRLPLPLAADEGPYRIYVGFYDPDTFERMPVIDDRSGENAIVIDLPMLLADEQASAIKR